MIRCVLVAALVALITAAPAIAQDTDFDAKMSDADSLLGRRHMRRPADLTRCKANALQNKKPPVHPLDGTRLPGPEGT